MSEFFTCRSPRGVRREGVWPRRATLALALVVLASPVPEARTEQWVSAPPGRLEDLMDHFASNSGLRVPFRETRRLAILKDPIESEGVFFFAPPGDLARYTLRPGRSRIIVRGDRLVFDDGMGRQSLDLATNETARGFVENFGVFLRGDLAELRRRYSVDFRTAGDSWTLEMRPLSRRMRHLVERIEIEGRGITMNRMTTFDTQGDQTEIVFGKVVPFSELEESTKESVFSLDFSGAPP